MAVLSPCGRVGPTSASRDAGLTQAPYPPTIILTQPPEPENMDKIAALKVEIDQTRTILEEARENLEKNPGQYSAQLLFLSTENHLSDLLKQLDFLQMQQDIGQ